MIVAAASLTALLIATSNNADNPRLITSSNNDPQRSSPTGAITVVATTRVPVSTTPPAWERDCPGSRRRVKYDATGSGTSSGSVTMAMPDGTQQADVSLPMKNDSGSQGVQFCSAAGEFVYISVQNRNDSGSVTCTITIDNIELAEVRSSGAYVIASCDGSVP